jgi:hypothetical protein
MFMLGILRAAWRTPPHPRPAGGAGFAAAIAVVALHAAPAAAQQTGRVVGRVVDAGTGAGIVGAQVQVVGTALGAVAGVDGRFTIVNVPATTFSLQARRIGYQPKAVTGLQLAAGQAVEQNITLAAATVQLDVVSVTAAAERGSTREALDRQRTADNVVNSITSEQIAKSPDSDASQAVGRVSGVTVQEGRFVFVRGLGERYTTTSLNGARLPSPEPERRVVPLDMFPSALLQSVTTSKTFTPDQAGDFSGAQVDLRTREFPARRQVQYSSTIGYNAAATGQSVFSAPGHRARVARLRRLGPLAPHRRRARRQLRPAAAAVRDQPDRGRLPQRLVAAHGAGDAEHLARRLGRGQRRDPRPPHRLRGVGELLVRAGGARERGARLRRAHRRHARGGPLRGDHGAQHRALGRARQLQHPLRHRHAPELQQHLQPHRRRRGAPRERLQREPRAAALRGPPPLRGAHGALQPARGEHQLGERHRVDWSLTSSGVSRREPDRSEFVQASSGEPNAAPFWLDASESAVRTFGELSESNLSSSADYTLQFGGAERQHKAKVGGLFRYTDRAADNLVFSIQSSSLSLEERRLAPEQLFGGQFTEPGDASFRVVPLGQGGSYDAREFVSAGYAMTDYALSERLRFVGGARVEFSSTEVNAAPTWAAGCARPPSTSTCCRRRRSTTSSPRSRTSASRARRRSRAPSTASWRRCSTAT